MTSPLPAVPVLPGLADLSPLGRGGLADVWLARQIHLERWVAAKVFRVTLADEQAAERFRAECRAVGRLDRYPHMLTVYDAGVLDDGRPYLISECCDGSLHDLLVMRGPLPPDRVAALGTTMCRALRFAHAAGVLHGDVTPGNILVRTSGAPVLADFGLAVLRENAATAAGYTPTHAAPEALDGAPVDERTDVYGLGSTLYTVLTGTAPFAGRPDEDASAHAARVRAGPPPRPDDGVPAPLAGLLTAMLATDPKDRPSTDEVIAGLSGSTAPAGPEPTLVATRPAAVPDPAGVRTATRTAVAPSVRVAPRRVPGRRYVPPPRPRRSRTLAVRGAAAALLLTGAGAAVLGGVAVLADHGHGPDRIPPDRALPVPGEAPRPSTESAVPLPTGAWSVTRSPAATAGDLADLADLPRTSAPRPPTTAAAPRPSRTPGPVAPRATGPSPTPLPRPSTPRPDVRDRMVVPPDARSGPGPAGPATPGR